MTTHSLRAEAAGSDASLEPVGGPQRIDALDTLRGFALLGILAMNILAFSMPGAAYMNPTVWGGLDGANYWVWLLGHLLADQKMMSIFSMLFGAGIALFAERAAVAGRSPVALHVRRSLWLIVFGLLHAYLLWWGDILFLYGVCALAVFWFRDWSPGRLLALGLAMLAVSSLVFLFFGWSMQYWPPEALAEFIEESWYPGPERLAAEVAAYGGSWMDQMHKRAPTAFEMQTFFLATWGFWRASGLMLVGMALYRLGVLSAQRSAACYSWMIIAGVLIGLPLVAYGVHWNEANAWGPQSMFYGFQFNYWGSIPVSLGWIGAVMLLCRSGMLAWLRSRLAAVGRLAFSNYILQSLICTTIFYGHGFGLFGEVERVGQIAIVAGIWLFQLLVSPLWLRRFRFGPLEWLWRSLTYGRRQPFVRA
jgi:uncharacterized protein